MHAHLVLTVIGPDRPGLIRAIAEEITAAGGNWLESRMASLAGQFAGIVLASVPRANADELVARLEALRTQGLRLTIERGAQQPALPDRGMHLDLVGHDRPGIVRDITRVLADRGVSVDELETEAESGSFSGESLFRARARLRLPPALTVDALRDALESLANELMVDITLGKGDAG